MNAAALAEGIESQSFGEPPEIVGRKDILWAKLRYSRAGGLVEDAAGSLSRLLPRPRPARPSRVLLYSGQFAPFHRGHLAELEGALALGRFDRVIVAPAMRPPGMPTEDRGPAWLRMLLTRRALRAVPAAQVDSSILSRHTQGAPATVEAFRRKLGRDAEITFLMGSDNYRGMTRWAGLEGFLEHADVLVNVRPDYPVAAAPLEALPESIRSRYRPAGPDTFQDSLTGRKLRFVRINGPSVNSHEALNAVREENWPAVARLLGPEVAGLVSHRFYPDIDWEADERRFLFQKASRPIFHRVFGLETGERLLAWGLLGRLERIPPDRPETTALIADAVYRAAREMPGGFAAEPKLYSRAVKLALDPDFRSLLRTSGAPSQPSEPSPTPPAPGVRVAGPRGRLPARFRSAIERLRTWLQNMTLDFYILSDGPAPASLFAEGDGKVRVYVGIDKNVTPATLRAEGVQSRYARLHGRQAVDALITRTGPRRALLEHLRGRYTRSVLVASSLDPRVAGSFAGSRGLVVAADVPLAEAHFANDPELWSGTVFWRGGNPGYYLHEVALREIRPEWIVGIHAPTDTSWRPGVSARLRTYAEVLLRPVTERLPGRRGGRGVRRFGRG